MMVSVFYCVAGVEGGTVRYVEESKIMTVLDAITDGEVLDDVCDYGRYII